jgi:hypothetical protein
MTDINLFYTNVGLSYKFTKWFRWGVSYRMINKHKETGDWGLRHRLQSDFNFRVRPGRFVLGYRARLQGEIRGAGYASETAKVPEVYLRNLFKVGFKATKDWTPYAGTELRFQLKNPRVPYYNGFDRSRFFVGTDYAISKVQSVGFYLLYQREWNVSDPQTLYIIGVEYALSFK